MQAMKGMRKDALLERHQVIRIKNELLILKEVHESKHISQVKWCFHTSDKVIFVQDQVHGGDLFQHLQKNTRLPEESVRIWISELSFTLNQLHEKKIIQRNLKSSSVLLDRTGNAKLCDFGLAKSLKSSTSTRSFCGNPEQMAPEMLTGGDYSFCVD